MACAKAVAQYAQTKAENMESDSCSVSVLLVVDECECIVPLEIAVVVSQFVCKSLSQRRMTLTIVMYLTLAKSIFFA